MNRAKVFISKPTPTDERGTGVHDHRTVYLVGDTRLLWSAPFPLPEVGDRIVITMNSIGPAIVKGYFSQGGYVGVMTLALKPPKWLREQQKRDAKTNEAQWVKDGIGCEFGTEIALPKRKPRVKQEVCGHSTRSVAPGHPLDGKGNVVWCSKCQGWFLNDSAN